MGVLVTDGGAEVLEGVLGCWWGYWGTGGGAELLVGWWVLAGVLAGLLGYWWGC